VSKRHASSFQYFLLFSFCHRNRHHEATVIVSWARPDEQETSNLSTKFNYFFPHRRITAKGASLILITHKIMPCNPRDNLHTSTKKLQSFPFLSLNNAFVNFAPKSFQLWKPKRCVEMSCLKTFFFAI
jgi:hypothetical protein